MKKTLTTFKNIIVIIGYISSIITLFEFIINYKDLKTKLIETFRHFDLSYVGQFIQIIGLTIIMSGALIFLFVKVINRFEPSRDLADIIAPLLLSKDIIGDSEDKFDRKLRLFRFIRVGVVILIVGLVSVIITLIYK